MTAWWEQPYQGGKMVPVPGFPRPLHVGDADGPDVAAYKRTVSRAGRWPWGTFDDTFSQGFSTGKAGGNVGDSGVAGVQRQGGIDPDSGQIGEATFNLLRSIIIPEGLPHAGEYAMDANAQTLLGEAYRMFHQAPPPKETTREQALAEAVSHIGMKESPSGSNQQPFGVWYGMNGVPWCAIFCTYCVELGTDKGSTSFQRGSRYSYVPTIVADARANRNGLSVTSSPQPGNLVCYDWDGGDYDHVGFFESGTASSWQAVEGNTSPDSGGNQSNGGEVCRRQRRRSDAHAVTFVRYAE